MKNDTPFNVSDLPIFDGRVYHLDLRPEELSKNIIIVGDPGRVRFIADEFLNTLEIDRFHRGLRTITGTVKETGQKVSVITSGMGTPSLEIVLNEIVALNEIDFHSRTRKAEFDAINIIRVGTAGGIQPDNALGTLIITDYAVGLDNTGLFYEVPCYDKRCKILEERIRETIDAATVHNSRFRGKIFPYASRAHPDVVKALAGEAVALDITQCKKGITVSNSGFFANQGRDISRVPVAVPDLDVLLASVDTGTDGLKIENMEMEASFLLHFMGALNYRAGVICAIIDKRNEDAFAEKYIQYIKNAVRVALRTLQAIGK